MLLNSDLSVEGFFVDIRLRKKTRILCSSYNLDLQLEQYENFVLMGDFNLEPNHATMKKILSDLRLQRYCQR